MTVPAPEPLLCPWTWADECDPTDPAAGPCWPKPPQAKCCDTWDTEGVTDEDRELALRVAVLMLWRASGRRFGACPTTVRPCRDTCAGGQVSPVPWLDVPGTVRPYLDGGRWFNETCGVCRSGCSCDARCTVTLPGPVHSVLEVKVDGEVVPAAGYVVLDARKLATVGDTECWPTCQDITAPDTEPGTFSVTYRRGLPVPDDGVWAAGLLACQLLQACAGAGECALPANVQTVTREGLTLDLAPVLLGANGGKTGVPEADAWIQSVNPHGLQSRSRVYSPDHMPPSRVTWRA